MKLLEGPYGWDSVEYVSIALDQVQLHIDEMAVVDVLLKYSCHKPAIPKILNSLRYAGHYECYLQRNWFKHSEQACKRDLLNVGILLTVLHIGTYDEWRERFNA